MNVKPRPNSFGFDQSDESDNDEEQPKTMVAKISTRNTTILGASRPLSGDLKRVTDSKLDEYDFVGEPKRPCVQAKTVIQKNTIVQKTQIAAPKSKPEARGSYTHKWGSDDDEEEQEEEQKEREIKSKSPSKELSPDEEDPQAPSSSSSMSMSQQQQPATLVKKTTTTTTTIKYEVRRAKQCLDQGELKDFQDDLEYFAETLGSAEATTNLKCLSMVKLTKRNATFEFRQYLRTKPALFQKLIEYLKDSYENASLSLCVSAFFYMLARDAAQFSARIIPMKLLFECLKQDKAPMDAEYKSYQASIWEIIQEWKRDCEKRKERSIVFDVSERNLTPGYLAIVTLDYVVARAPTKNKRLQSDLLNLGFFQTLIAKVDKVVLSLKLLRNPNEEILLQHLYELEHAFRIVENGIMLEKKNQMFVVGHRSGVLLFSCEKYLDYFCQEISKYETGTTLSKQLFYVLSLVFRLTMNASHSNDVCALKLGQIGNFFANTVQVLTNIGPRYAEKDKMIDLTMLLCGLLVNLTEKSAANRRKVSNMRLKHYYVDEETEKQKPVNGDEVELSLLEILTRMFIKHETMARIVDEELDNELLEEVPEDDPEAASNDEEDGDRLIRPTDMNEDEIISALNSAMQKATSHMQDSMMASYIGLLIGCLVQTDEVMVDKLRSLLPNGDLSPMLEQLERFREFAELTKIVDITCIANVIQSLKAVGLKSR